MICSAAMLLSSILGVFLYFGLKNAPERLFLQVSEPVIALNGNAIPDASVYRSSRGVWLIDMVTVLSGTHIRATKTTFTRAIFHNEYSYLDRCTF
jgi:hypothetical protein